MYFKEIEKFKLIDKIVDGGYKDTITNGNIQRIRSSRDAKSGVQAHSSTIQKRVTGTHNDEISNFNQKRTRISDSSMENDTTNNGNVKYSMQESETTYTRKSRYNIFANDKKLV